MDKTQALVQTVIVSSFDHMAKMARELSQTIPDKVSGREALLAFASAVEESIKQQFGRTIQ